MTDAVDKPAQDKPVQKAKQTKSFTGSVVLATTKFNVRQPALLDQAEALFREQAAEKGATKLSDVVLTGVDKTVGESATYHFSAISEG